MIYFWILLGLIFLALLQHLLEPYWLGRMKCPNCQQQYGILQARTALKQRNIDVRMIVHEGMSKNIKVNPRRDYYSIHCARCGVNSLYDHGKLTPKEPTRNERN